MAGGIDWFRWHHGSVNDQKFPLVARRAGASVAEVIAVWACLLERASMNEDQRGVLGDAPDFEAMDCALGLPDGRCLAIFNALQQRNMVDEGLAITAWDRRQPKREDSTAADRKRAQRERDAAKQGVTPPDVTQCHAESRDVTTEERRGEKKEQEEANASSSAVPTTTPIPKCPFQTIVDLYHDTLPELPRAVRLDSKGRKEGILRVWKIVLTEPKSNGEPRAKTLAEAVEWFGRYFDRARDNDFLMGRTARGQGHENWTADLDFLMTDRGMKHVIEKTRVAA